MAVNRVMRRTRTCCRNWLSCRLRRATILGGRRWDPRYTEEAAGAGSRAVATGAAELVRRTVREDGFKSEGTVCGGPTKGVLRTRMHADASNFPNSYTREPGVSALGSTPPGYGTAPAEPARPAKASGDTWGGR